VGFIETFSTSLIGWIVVGFLIILAIAWTLLPFAMFGIKPLLRDLIAETRQTNRLLEELRGPGNTSARPDAVGRSLPAR
jgi:hypothetical protein